MNRQVKRQMARQGTDKPRAPERKQPAPGTSERTSPRQYLREVQGEMKKVAWPTRQEVLNSTIVVLIGVTVMASIIFVFDYGALHLVDVIFG
ncbi:MAG: preprotein translocase subunit SecE [Actinomycetota bacterium]